MIKAALWTRRAGYALAVVTLFLLFSYILFPTAKIDAVLANILARQNLKLAPALHKTLLPGLAWDDMSLSSDQGELLKGQRLGVRPLLLPLITGRAVLFADAKIGNGELKAKYALNGKDAVDLFVDSISLADIPFFKTALGATTTGNLWIQGKLLRSAKRLNGDLKLEVKQFQFSGVKLGAFSLPDAVNLKAQGMIKVTDSKARLESFTIEGDGLYMRLSGDIPSAANAAVTPLNMNLEIMPKPDFLEKQKLVFMLLAKFMTAPGIYTIPIKGTLLKPTIL